MNTILILTNTHDTSTDWVIKELRLRKAPFVRINADVLDQCALSFTPGSGSFLYQGPKSATWDLSNAIDVVYLRRPDPRPVATSESSPEQKAIMRFVDNQWRALLRGLQIIDAKWVNPLSDGDKSETKILQLWNAQKCGFVVPETLVTNDPSKVRDFAAGRNKVVVKALDAPLLEFSRGSDFIYTQVVDAATLCDPLVESEVRAAPAIYQQAIVNKTDVRVTVIRDKVLAAEITHRTAEIDWRRVPSGETAIRGVQLPPAIREACINLVSACGLVYGAIDLGKSGDEYFFFELNPSGEWGWLQYAGLPIASAIADILVHES